MLSYVIYVIDLASCSGTVLSKLAQVQVALDEHVHVAVGSSSVIGGFP
jgi:hypothetical protein